ncbi:beta-ketoacyl synthase N-terminal-like domain-containing protein [Paenibacillus sp. DR312]|uniref:beta-ketoacyl synthase N-terminal-like domain-containing protein n=2 Tax=Paenibacillus TaxID=44249 RepID=UPI000CFCF17E|nr:beta-ketoacyl synthase N-terminal-like domain-containing protein [Paenibacillus sp. DR312]PRA00599.1 hypothetical protein CQ043_25785 [Paenibacillus sp. MYb63]PRA49865.1 hypothetical protein CQ061_05320 [Paenibacillus sp. MYb67]QZN75726.1 hypothetical protein K5K90_31055 [Paenibacillus sp. DR312]
MERVFISSMGVITCVGTSLEEFWSGINTKKVDYNSIELPIILPQNINPKVSRRMDRFSRMSLSVSKLVLEKLSLLDTEQIGTVFNTGFGPLQSNINFRNQIETYGVDGVSPTLFTNTVFNAGLGHTCLHLGFKGPSTMLMGSNAVAYSYELIKSNKCDQILCCGVEEYIEELDHSFQLINSTTKNLDSICKPLDANRDGTRVTEGAGGLFIESESSLRSRSGKALCEILGYSNAITDEFRAIDGPNSDSNVFAQVMEMALKNAGICKDHIDGIFMASGGGVYADPAEAKAIHQVFGGLGSEIPVTAIKGAIGESIGASLILNVVSGILCLENQTLPLTSGCENPEESLNLNVIYDHAKAGRYKYLLINGYDISGCLFSIVIGEGD